MFKAYDNKAYEYMTSLSNKKLAELYAIEHWTIFDFYLGLWYNYYSKWEREVYLWLHYF
jgi:hypothetical protein